ncbi:SRPBCC family protein [Agriterribacter humi]|jgi:uncharacterized protein YndB with AHSA1/START domain|uniref:SRPBCC family protein n=1 Tax=Agriterribacter humi TaxID=1104781 RepID=UPI001265117E|nr:SRPBCC domain-containing protein [Agriterribacter humi]
MADINHQIAIKASAKKIYELISTKEGIQKWLTKGDGWKIKGKENLGDTLLFYFGENHHEMKISKLEPNKEVKWACIVGHPEWIGTSVSFIIESKGAENILHFAHKGWTKRTNFFKQCSQVWEGSVVDIKNVVEAK